MTAVATLRRVRVAVVNRPAAAPRNRRSWLEPAAVAGYLLLLGAVLIRAARVRVFWFDELFTMHLSRDIPNLLANLKAGADLNPPLTYLLTALSTALFGESPLTVRLPGIGGAVLGSLAFYVYLRRYLPAAFAAAGMGFLALTPQIWNFFCEARPYGLVFGLSAATLLAWDRAAASKRWAGAFAVFAIAGVCTHYFFPAVLAALAATDCVRRSRRSWPGFVLAAITLAALSPLWYGASRDYAPGFWAKPAFDLGAVVQAYRQLFPLEAGPAVLMSATVAVLLGCYRRESPGTAVPGLCGIPLTVLAAAPILGCFVGSLAGGYYFRYSLPAILGAGGVFAVALARTAAGRPAAGWIAFAACAYFGCAGHWTLAPVAYRADARDLRDTVTWLGEKAPHGTVICDDPFDFTRFWHTAPDAGFDVAFPADPARAVQHTGADTIDRGLESLNRVTTVPLMTFDDVPPGDVYFLGPTTSWRAEELAARGWSFSPRGERKHLKLWKLTRE